MARDLRKIFGATRPSTLLIETCAATTETRERAAFVAREHA
jgi:hypothetical protein